MISRLKRLGTKNIIKNKIEKAFGAIMYMDTHDMQESIEEKLEIISRYYEDYEKQQEKEML